MRSRLALLTAALLLLVALVPPLARADGDPASDVLLGENVFYPYTPVVSPSVQNTLQAEVAAAHKAHFPIKVALIASPVDLGVIPDLFGKPQQYARFLDQEISFQGFQPLLVVMSTGFGTLGLSARVTAAVATLTKPVGGTSTDLAKAAITAIAKLASVDGHPVSGVSGVPGGGGGSGGGSSALIVVLVLVALACAGALAALTLRRRRSAA
jgi:hypothetical protein